MYFNTGPEKPGFFFCPRDTTGLVELTLEERIDIIAGQGNYMAAMTNRRDENQMTDLMCVLDNSRIPTHRTPGSEISGYHSAPMVLTAASKSTVTPELYAAFGEDRLQKLMSLLEAHRVNKCLREVDAALFEALFPPEAADLAGDILSYHHTRIEIILLFIEWDIFVTFHLTSSSIGMRISNVNGEHYSMVYPITPGALSASIRRKKTTPDNAKG